MKKINRFAGIFVVLMTLSAISFNFYSCSIYKALTMNKPSVVSLEKVSIQRVTFEKIDLAFSILMKNENSFRVGIAKSDYDVYINDVFVGHGNIINKQFLSPETNSIVSIPITIERSIFNTETLKIFLDLATGKQMSYTIKGNITVDIDGDEFSAPMDISKNI